MPSNCSCLVAVAAIGKHRPACRSAPSALNNRSPTPPNPRHAWPAARFSRCGMQSALSLQTANQL